MSEIIFFRKSDGGMLVPSLPLAGEVVFDLIEALPDKKEIKELVRRSIELRLEDLRGEAGSANYLVIFSPGQQPDEIRCQVEIETDGNWAAFAVGYGQSTDLAFNDTVERMQWAEMKESTRMII